MLSQVFIGTENRTLDALARLDDFIMNPLNQGHSGTAPVTSRNAFSTCQGSNEDDYQIHLHLKAGIFLNQTTQNFGPENGHDSPDLVGSEECHLDKIGRLKYGSPSCYTPESTSLLICFLFPRKLG